MGTKVKDEDESDAGKFKFSSYWRETDFERKGLMREEDEMDIL